MNADHPPTIFGWTPSGPAIALGGVVIAIAVGSIGLTIVDPLLPSIAWLFAPAILLLLGSASARMVWRRRTAPSTTVVTMGVTMKLANMVAIVLLGLAALAAFVSGHGVWRSLTNAFVLDLVLGGLIAIGTAVAGNVSTFVTNQSPPATPPA